MRRLIAAVIAALSVVSVGVVAADDDDTVHVDVLPGEGVWQVAQRLCPSSVFVAYRSLIQANPWVVDTGLDPGTVLHWRPSACPTPPTTTIPTTTAPTTSTPSSTSSSTTTSSAPPTTVPSQQVVNVGTTTFRSSSLGALPIETIGGVTYEVIANRLFVIDGGYFLIDEPNILVRDSVVQGGRRTVNTGAMIQTAGRDSQGNLIVRNVRIERVSFDGGTIQNRGIQSDTANLYVYRSRFHRTGNAAVEMNARSFRTVNGQQVAIPESERPDFVVEDSVVTGAPGWPRDAHVDGLQVGGARNVTIRNNTIHLAMFGGTPGDASYIANSCLGLWAELGNTGTTVVEGNDLDGCGGSGIYLEQKAPFVWTSTVTVRNNTFGRGLAYWFVLAPTGPQGGSPQGLPANLTWTGNQWDDGAPLSLSDAQRCCLMN